MTKEEEEQYVIDLANKVNNTLAGNEIGHAHTALSIAVAVSIISLSNDAKERDEMYGHFCQHVKNFLTPEWIDYIKAHVKLITLRAPERPQ